MAGVVQTMTTGFRLDLGPLKEPLGFIRVLEWVFSIFAFATTGGYSGSTSVKVKCDGQLEDTFPAHFQYPFRLASSPFNFPTCNQTNPNQFLVLSGDFSSSAEFFVCVGVFAFIYCTVTLVLYLGYQHLYRDSTRGPIVDLFVTGAFAFLWLVSSSAWGKALTDIKFATNPDHLVNVIDTCKTLKVCEVGQWPAMGRLNASVIFGFLNLILWGGNCWFIYKETPFHKPTSPPVNVEEGAGHS
ncbi:synaptophysin-like protein 2 [Arapaima gigas]